jgi:hypothetical protein
MEKTKTGADSPNEFHGNRLDWAARFSPITGAGVVKTVLFLLCRSQYLQDNHYYPSDKHAGSIAVIG